LTLVDDRAETSGKNGLTDESDGNAVVQAQGAEMRNIQANARADVAHDPAGVEAE